MSLPETSHLYYQFRIFFSGSGIGSDPIFLVENTERFPYLIPAETDAAGDQADAVIRIRTNEQSGTSIRILVHK